MKPSKNSNPQNSFTFPETGISVANEALLLSIDDATFSVKRNLCLYLSKPTVRPEGVMGPEPQSSTAPDNLAAHFYGTVLEDEGKFRMWYYALHYGQNPDWPAAMKEQLKDWDTGLSIGPLCYAESEDGLTWTKPNLGQVLFKGSTDNNAFALPHAIVSCATVVKDLDEPDAERRYKMVYQFFYDKNSPQFPELTGFTTCAMAVSPDGLKWTVLGTPFPHDFVEHASFYQHDGKYIVNSHQHSLQVPGEGGTPRGRQAFTRMAYNFDEWLDGQVESFTLPEPAEVSERGIYAQYPQVHLGVGAASFGTACIGLYGLWYNSHHDDDFEAIACDFGLVVSNDGLHFREPVKNHVYMSRHDSPAPTVPGKNFHTVLCQANGIINVGEETRIYHGRWRNTEEKNPETGESYAYGEVALATLPRDRWGALGLFPEQERGHVWSAPVVLPASETQLFLNAEGADCIAVEIATEFFEPLTAYSGENRGCSQVEGGLGCRVQWSGSGLQDLAGQTVRFKFLLQKNAGVSPRLYAVNLKAS